MNFVLPIYYFFAKLDGDEREVQSPFSSERGLAWGDGCLAVLGSIIYRVTVYEAHYFLGVVLRPPAAPSTVTQLSTNVSEVR